MHDENTVPGDGVEDSLGSDTGKRRDRTRQRLWAAAIIAAAAIIGGGIVAATTPAGPAASSRPGLLPTPVMTPPPVLKTVQPVARKAKPKPKPSRTPVQAPSSSPAYAAAPTAAPSTYPQHPTAPAAGVPQQNCYAPPHPTCTPGPPPASLLRPPWSPPPSRPQAIPTVTEKP